MFAAGGYIEIRFHLVQVAAQVLRHAAEGRTGRRGARTAAVGVSARSSWSAGAWSRRAWPTTWPAGCFGDHRRGRPARAATNAERHHLPVDSAAMSVYRPRAEERASISSCWRCSPMTAGRSGYARVGTLSVASPAQRSSRWPRCCGARAHSAPAIGGWAALAPASLPGCSRRWPRAWLECGSAAAPGSTAAIRDSLLRAAAAAARAGTRHRHPRPGRGPGDRRDGGRGPHRRGRRSGRRRCLDAGSAQPGIRLPVGPQRGQIVHARLPGTDPPHGRSCCPARTPTWSPSPPGGRARRDQEQVGSPTTPPWAG